ncbi:ABC transporter substrate-binding protein [Streptosporangium saharense]|uniref:Iron complex transport system substrate-binding protein n=1 Tax=Streptosporangium saharense TaxID=1706840 RepID=A0A7W7VNK5_9ACTN|nr:ABC transporter substrate-binding protein [Streptosporangium saharense]MBB4916996.1 iron complex transport system substrate-binding protein [Streptosporangium saharense]
MRVLTRRSLVAAATLVAVLLSAGCVQTYPEEPAPEVNLVSVDGCGAPSTTVALPPKRVVVLTPSVLELLLWLDLGDRVVAIGQQPRPGSLPERFSAQVNALRSLSGKYTAGSGYKAVPKEELLSVDPDLVVGGFASNFDAPGAMSRDDLELRRIPSYLALSTACKKAVTRPLTGFDLVWRDLENLGTLFRVRDRAERVIAEMRRKIAPVQEKVRGVKRPTVFPFEFDEGTATPYAPGNRQAVNAVIETAGGRNVFGDRNEAYTKVGWEEVVARDPQVILVIIYDRGDPAANEAHFAEAERFLTTSPALRGVRAVTDKRFARLVYETASVGGVRNADAVVELAEQLHPAR